MRVKTALKKAAVSATAVVLSLALSGCTGYTIYSNYREVEELEVIRVIAVDKNDGGVAATAASGMGIDREQPVIYENEGATLSEALYRMQSVPVGKEPLFSHTEHMIIGQQMAESGIAGVLDYIERSTETRLDTNLFVVRGMRGGEFVEETCAGETTTADALTFLKSKVEKNGDGHVFNCNEVASSLARSGYALILAVEPARAARGGEDEEKMVNPAGYAVISDGRLAGFIDPEMAKGATIVMGYMDYLCMQASIGDGETASLGIIGIDTDFKPEYVDGTLKRVEINAEVSAEVLEIGGGAKLTSESARRQVTAQISENIKNWMDGAIAQSQEYDMDYLGLGRKVEMAAPEKFAGIRETWKQEFRNVEFDVKVDSLLKRTFDINDPVSVSGKGV